MQQELLSPVTKANISGTIKVSCKILLPFVSCTFCICNVNLFQIIDILSIEAARNMDSREWVISVFLQRLKLLQCLCSSKNPDLPAALLFVPGPDGRNNKGSLIMLKYVLLGAIGKELLEGVIDSFYECIEESILVDKYRNIKSKI